MKTNIKASIIVLASITIGLNVQGQAVSSKTNSCQINVQAPNDLKSLTSDCVQGVITVKLKKGVGEFGKQTRMVQFGVQSLDDKVATCQVYQLEKRFRYNPANLRADLPDLSRIYKISFPESSSVKEVAETFSSDSNVEYAEPIPIGHFADVPNDALYSQLQHLPQIHAPEAWDIHKGENGIQEIVIAIIDTGVDWDHEDLQSNIWQNLAEDFDGDGHTMEYNGIQWVLDPGDLNGVDDDSNGFTDDLLGWNFITATGDPNPIPGNPLIGHGTHCAGISCASTNNGTGIASISWNLKVMPICVDANNTIPYGWDGIIYAAENGADIISNSWGGPNYYNAGQEAVSYAAGLGSIVLGAAHNQDSTLLIYPACYQDIISVAAVNVDDTKTDYSNYNLAVDISAPGGGTEGGIWSTVPGNSYEPWNGTSMATPLVAGCFGLLKSYRPDWSNDRLITQVLGTADNIDSLNPNYINMLGTGRVNAYRMLLEENVLPFLKLEFLSVSPDDANGNGINEQGENVTLNFELKNYAQGLGMENVVVSISTDDPEIIIINGTCNTYIPSDSSFSITDQLQIQVGADATPHVAELTLHFDTISPILMGQDMIFNVLVAPSGIFVFEGEENGQDYSGTLITGFLDHLGYEYTYANNYPSLLGFETVFLSHGNFGQNMDMGTEFTISNALAVKEYLESGGNLYVEMGGMFYKMTYSQYPNIAAMKLLFGVNTAMLYNNENPIDTLFGAANTPMDGMLFAGSDQKYNWHIDKLTPKPVALIPFVEQDYGNVAIMYDGSSTYGQKTFYMGYSLAELRDRDAISSRYNVLLKTMEFFGYDQAGYILSNFLTDKTAGGLPLEVQFTDISLSDPVYPILSWQWDFDNDGTIDSEEQNPVWIYDEPGDFAVKLITTNALNSDTLILENLITVNSGYLVYEGVENGDDYSGVFIRDYLQENAYTVTYRSDFPQSLEGYWSVFLSFGNGGSGGTVLNNEMAAVLTDYLENGGYVYLEGGDALGNDQVNNAQLLNLFGLVAATNGTGTNPINSLEGKPAAITHDMVFNSNSQISNTSIDKYAPSANGKTAFTESGYGTVAAQQSISNGRRTFCFSYSLSDLTDVEYPNTREELLHRIMNFFDIYTYVPEIEEQPSINCKVYPNPFGNSTILDYQLSENSLVTLTLFNHLGQKVAILVNDQQSRGAQQVQWNANGLPAGVYYYHISAGNSVKVGKMVRVK
jgi:serine protease